MYPSSKFFSPGSYGRVSDIELAGELVDNHDTDKELVDELGLWMLTHRANSSYFRVLEMIDT